MISLMVAVPFRRFQFVPPALATDAEFELLRRRLAEPAYRVGAAPGMADVVPELILLATFAGMLGAGLLIPSPSWLGAALGFAGGILGLGTLLSLLSIVGARRAFRHYNDLLRQHAMASSSHAQFLEGFGKIHRVYEGAVFLR
jgi:hypothetical protein